MPGGQKGLSSIPVTSSWISLLQETRKKWIVILNIWELKSCSTCHLLTLLYEELLAKIDLLSDRWALGVCQQQLKQDLVALHAKCNSWYQHGYCKRNFYFSSKIRNKEQVGLKKGNKSKGSPHYKATVTSAPFRRRLWSFRTNLFVGLRKLSSICIMSQTTSTNVT